MNDQITPQVAKPISKAMLLTWANNGLLNSNLCTLGSVTPFQLETWSKHDIIRVNNLT